MKHAASQFNPTFTRLSLDFRSTRHTMPAHRVPRTPLKALTDEQRKEHKNKLARKREEEKRATRLADAEARRLKLVNSGVARIREEEEASVRERATKIAWDLVQSDATYVRRRARQLEGYKDEVVGLIVEELKTTVPETPRKPAKQTATPRPNPGDAFSQMAQSMGPGQQSILNPMDTL